MEQEKNDLFHIIKNTQDETLINRLYAFMCGCIELNP